MQARLAVVATLIVFQSQKRNQLEMFHESGRRGLTVMTRSGETPVIQTDRLILTMLTPDDAPRMLDFALENREHLDRWDREDKPATF
jgi:hypothetical protein